MGLSDRLREAAKKAEEAASERKGQIREAVQKAGASADQRTGGKYHDRIEKATAKADSVVDRIKDPDAPATDGSEARAAADEPGSSGTGFDQPPPGG